MRIERVGVVGCGLMGSGIAQVTAVSGYRVIVREPEDRLLQQGLGRVREGLERMVEKERLGRDRAEAANGRLGGTVDLDGLSECDLVIEAVTEDYEVKAETFAALDDACPEGVVFASNTSSLSITRMAVQTERPDRFLGLHFFNPVPAMGLVEVVETLLVSGEVVEAGMEFARSLDKTPVRVKDRAGFIVNRLLVPYLLEAVRILDDGLASMEDIDQAMKLGAGYPMGPFRLLDLVGLETTLSIAEIMYDEFREPRFAPPPLLERMVLAGRLGRKSGRGFYEYGQGAS